MKKCSQIMIAFLAAIFFVVVAVNLNAQDKKDIKKEVTKVLKTDKQNDCDKPCSEMKAKENCQHPEKCDQEKHDCHSSAASEHCQKKHAAGECNGAKPDECCKSDQTKKQTEKKDQK